MKKGFTLIEMLVAVAIFFIVVSIPTGFFVLSLKSQKRVLALREIIDNSSYALEYTSRALRMARKDDIEIGGVVKDCLSGDKVNYEITNGGQGIKFRNYLDKCQKFYLSGTQLREWKDDGTDLPLTSDNLEITLLEFYLSGATQGDSLQPRVTILFEIQKKGQPGTKIHLQTTISQRNLDVTY